MEYNVFKGPLFVFAEVPDVITLPKTPFFSRLNKDPLIKPVSRMVSLKPIIPAVVGCEKLTSFISIKVKLRHDKT